MIYKYITPRRFTPLPPTHSPIPCADCWCMYMSTDKLDIQIHTYKHIRTRRPSTWPRLLQRADHICVRMYIHALIVNIWILHVTYIPYINTYIYTYTF